MYLGGREGKGALAGTGVTRRDFIIVRKWLGNGNHQGMDICLVLVVVTMAAEQPPPKKGGRGGEAQFEQVATWGKTEQMRPVRHAQRLSNTLITCGGGGPAAGKGAAPQMPQELMALARSHGLIFTAFGPDATLCTGTV